MKSTSVLSVIAVTGLAGSAQAGPSLPQQVLPNILSTSPGGSLDLRGDYTNVQEAGGPSIVGLNAHFQYLTPSNFGFYGQIPFAYVSNNGDSETSLGNLELGGLYVMRKTDLDIYLRGGLALDTAGQTGGFLVPLANVIPRLSDAFPSGSESNWLRAHVGLRNTTGVVRFGASAGVDLALDNDNEDGLLVLNGSLGMVQSNFGISGGLTYLQLIGDDRADNNTLGFNAVADFVVGSSAKLFVALGINLEDEFDGFSLGFGARIGI